MSSDTTEKTEVVTKVDHNFKLHTYDKLRKWEQTRTPEYFEYRTRWENAPLEKALERFPIHLDIEATSNCNLLCTMCPRTDMIEDGTFWKVENMSFEFYKRFIDEGVQKGLCSVKFNYLGEPLMNREIFKWVAYAKEKGVVDVMFNTNATLLTARNSRRLIESGLDKLFFSFDSPNKEHYERIRVKGKFQKTFDNIVRFHEIRAEMGSITPYTRVSMVRLEENEHECDQFLELFENVVDSVGFCQYLDHSNKTKDQEIIKKKKNTFCCPQLWQRMFIHPDGVVTVCCNDAARTLKVGDFNESNLEDIWLGDEYTRLRELHQTGRIDEIDTCRNCSLAQLE